jgi:hypothetical protein
LDGLCRQERGHPDHAVNHGERREQCLRECDQDADRINELLWDTLRIGHMDLAGVVRLGLGQRGDRDLYRAERFLAVDVHGVGDGDQRLRDIECGVAGLDRQPGARAPYDHRGKRHHDVWGGNEPADGFGNAEGDWTGCIAGQEGIRMNLSMNPQYCDTSRTVLTVDEGGPCAPTGELRTDVAGGLYGAFRVDCHEGSGTPPPPPVPVRLGSSAAPNPATGAVSIAYVVPTTMGEAFVTVSAFDCAGRLIRELYRGRQSGGAQGLVWDGLDSSGRSVRPGIYFCRITINGSRDVVRIAMIR